MMKQLWYLIFIFQFFNKLIIMILFIFMTILLNFSNKKKSEANSTEPSVDSTYRI